MSWILGLRKLRSLKNVEALQVVLVLQVASWKKIFSWRKETAFFPYFHLKIVLWCAELFEWTFEHVFKHYHKSNIKGVRFEFYKKQPLVLGAAVEVFWKHMTGSKLSGLQLYFTGVFEDFGHIWSVLKIS